MGWRCVGRRCPRKDISVHRCRMQLNQRRPSCREHMQHAGKTVRMQIRRARKTGQHLQTGEHEQWQLRRTPRSQWQYFGGQEGGSVLRHRKHIRSATRAPTPVGSNGSSTRTDPAGSSTLSSTTILETELLCGAARRVLEGCDAPVLLFSYRHPARKTRIIESWEWVIALQVAPSP